MTDPFTRRTLVGGLLAAGLGFWRPPAAFAAATLTVEPRVFSPRDGTVRIRATIDRPQFVGVRLVTAAGIARAWIFEPTLRQTVDLRWNGQLAGQPVEDGLYTIEAVVWPWVVARAPLTIDAAAPQLMSIAVDNGGRPFAGDGPDFATVSPNDDSVRDAANFHFRLDEPATVRLEVVTTRQTIEDTIWALQGRYDAGRHVIRWKPPPTLPARTYLVRVQTVDGVGNRRIYGGDRRNRPWIAAAPIVRVLGVEAGFTARSYTPGQLARLRVEADTSALNVQIFRAGDEEAPTYRNDELRGTGITAPSRIDWSGKRHRPHAIKVRVGDWPSGLYFARLIARDGRLGFAPFVVRPGAPGKSRVAVVLPTNTWQAYNFRDIDRDGWGDTWYAGGNPPVDLQRAHLNRGVPFRFRSYDAGFIRWLSRTGKQVEFLSEEDLEGFGTGDRLAGAYDLVIFPGHTEYVTEAEYDIVQRYRDLGGNLWFLSANNFFWKVERRGEQLHRLALWRDLGRPEAGLIGVQYLANDDGTRRGGFVPAADAPPWAWDGAGVEPGHAFGSYGIEIDARSPASPPETQVLATIPDVYGPGRTAEMTYYELANGAKVFAAGVLDFGGSAERPAVRAVLENLWVRMSVS